jgi:predicted RecA/RadA family phage recombinase
MAEYVPLYAEADTFTSQASATITGGQVLIVSGAGTVAPSSAASVAVVGVAGNDAASGDKVTVITEGIHRLVATGTVTAGDMVVSAASGTVATGPGTAGQAVGVALTTATNPNKVEVLWAR